MNTLQNVYDKLTKTELGKHEVELSLISELQKFNAEAKIHLKAFRKSQADLKATAKIVVASGENFKSSLSDINNTARKISASFKELGLDFQANADIKESQKILNENSDVELILISAKQIVNK